MRTQINLTLEKEGIKKEAIKFFYTSIGFFVVCAILTGGLLGFRFFLDTQLTQQQQQFDQIQSQIKRQEDKKATLSILKSRLTETQEILKNQGKITKNFSDLLIMMPESLNIQSISVSAPTITLLFNTTNLADTHNFLTLLYNLNGEKTTIKKVKLQNFGLDQTKAGYSAQIDFSYQ